MDFVAIVKVGEVYGLYYPVFGPAQTRKACKKSLAEFMDAGGPDVVSWNTKDGALPQEQEEVLFNEGYEVMAVLDLKRFPTTDVFLGTATVIARICQEVAA